jgi:transposase
LAVKTYPGEEWKQGSNRATFEPDYGRRGKVWAHGAFEPASGQAALVLSERRDSNSHIRLIEQIMVQFPADQWILVEDNLSSHSSRETQLALLAHAEIQVLFLPKYACWLNLIEPWWKQIRSLALKGKRFDAITDLENALWKALDYWNVHRHPYQWKKKPQDQPKLSFGGFHPQLDSH